jgi:uncharacterized delta-60 repeat protein
VPYQSDAKILTSTQINDSAGSLGTHVVRLNSDGAFDSTFNDPVSKYAFIRALAVQRDGKILVGGGFGEFEGTARTNLVRLNSDGTLDSTFGPLLLNPWFEIYSIAIQQDGKVVIAPGARGREYSTGFVSRLTADGGFDPAFENEIEANSLIASVNVLPSGDILATGTFSIIDGEARSYLARLRGVRDQLQFEQRNGQLILSWTNPTSLLQSSSSANGPYSTILGAASPHPIPIDGVQRYFRLESN